MSGKFKNRITVIVTTLFILSFSVYNVCKPDESQSVSERRPLQSRPEWNMGDVTSGKFMTNFEKYTLDQFPLRDKFRMLKAFTVLSLLGQKDNNGIYIKNGYASKLEYPINQDSISYAAERFRFVYERYLAKTNANIYLSVIPDKNYWMAEENGYPAMNYSELISKLKNNMEYAEYIDITDKLTLSDYYRTDSHWRQEKIGAVASHLAESLGITLSQKNAVVKTDSPFYGVYYGQAALPLLADTISYVTNNVLGKCKVFDYETNTKIPVYDLKRLNSPDPYETYLSGSKSLLTIENPTADTDRELILFRDSFGSSLAPLLAEGYSKITLVDIRYLSPNLLGNFIDFSNQDVLFLYSTSVLNNSITIK